MINIKFIKYLKIHYKIGKLTKRELKEKLLIKKKEIEIV